ncbi:MAG: IPT/TIG domain-containing protein [Myxococcaceae bacterium]|nr:IPT/TIG domain-containing protein [Myxococcaceae bacterium]
MTQIFRCADSRRSLVLPLLAALAAAPAFAAPPTNDVCAGAEVIPPTGPFPYLTAITDLTSATDANDPISSCQSNAHLGIWYTFTPTVSGVYSFSTCNGNGGGTTVSDTVIGIYTSAAGCAGPFTQVPGGSGVGCDDDGCFLNGTQSVAGAPLTAGVTYYVVVQRFGTTAVSAGAGLVQLKVVQGAGNDACAAAAPLVLNMPQSGSNQTFTNDLQLPSVNACFSGVGQASSTGPGIDSVFSFTAAAAGKYSFRVSRWDRESINPLLYVSSDCPTAAGLNTVAACLGAANRTSSSALAGEEVWCLPLAQGDTVFATVDLTDPTAKGTPFSIEVTACDQETEPNDSVTSAAPLACGLEGGIAPTSSDVDFFALGANAAGERVFAMIDALSANSTNFDLRVTSDTLVMEYDDADVDTPFGGTAPVIAGSPLTGAPAYLRVSASSASEPYRLYSVIQPALGVATSEMEPNDTLLQPQMANYVRGALSSSSDVDVYAFAANAGEQVFIALDADPLRNNTPFNGALELLDPDGNLVVRANDSNSSSSNTAPTGLTSTTPNSPAEGIVWRLPRTGTWFVRVSSGSTSAGDYLLSISRDCAPSLAVTGATPSVGSRNGGDTITVSGANFQPGFTATIDGVAITPDSVSATGFTFTTPPHASGQVLIVVTNPDGSAGSTTFTYAPPPTITNLSRTSGSTLGGDTVVITGTFFLQGASVFFGSNAATVTDINGDGTQITAITPPGIAGPVDVTVTNHDGQTVTVTGLFLYVPPPVVTSVAPNPALGGDTVVITGTDFQNGATVLLDGVPAQVTFDDPTQLTVVIPGHLPGAVDLTVTNPDGQSHTVPGGFTYDSQGPAPTVVTLSPSSGSDLGGEAVVITGTGFFPGATVLFDNVPVPASDVTVDGPTQITVVTPAHAFGTVDVTVRNRDYQSATVSPGFTFVHAAPTVTAITPSGGNIAGGTKVTVTGTEFMNGATFSVGGVPATNVVVVDSTTMTGTTGPHAPGTVDVVVINADLQTATLPAAFTYALAPTATSLSPNQGSTLGGTAFTLTGSDFQPGATVSFGGVAATNLTVTATEITGTTPAHGPGKVNVVVTNPDGQSATIANAFTFVVPPIATSLSPVNGPASGGTRITISGLNFASGATVTVGGSPATSVNVVNANTITAVTPPGTPGTVDVTVTNPDGQFSTLTNAFTWVAPPVLTAISPVSGPAAGGTQVTLNGQGFLPGAAVFFGNTPVSATFVSPTQLTTTTPAGTAGMVDVTVKNPDDQTSTLANAFTFVAAPAVSTLSPHIGASAGGTQVTITGTGFVDGLTVSFDGVEATSVTVLNSQTLTAVTPAHPEGWVSVTVSNPDGQTSTLAQGFDFIAAPAMSGITPVEGSASGGTDVTISGDNFAPGATVTFGGAPATAVVFQSSTTLVATTPSHAAGTVDVVVTNPDGQSATLKNAFTFQPAQPAISVITPAAGPGDGNTPVLIGGSGFVAGAIVTFGGVEATQVEVVNSHTITLRTPAHDAGAVDVVVTNPGGTSAAKAKGYRYVSSPTDAGMDAGVDAGVEDAGVSDGGQLDYQGGSSGCGCTSADGASLAGFALLGLVAMVSRRRRPMSR